MENTTDGNMCSWMENSLKYPKRDVDIMGMFLNENYILSSELTEQMGIHTANISMLRNNLEDNNDLTSIIKMNSCNFMNKNSHNFPQNIKKGIRTGTFTKMHDKLPCSWVHEEYGFTKKELFDNKVVIKKITILKKQLYQFNPYFVKMMKNRIGYCLNENEKDYCIKHNEIDGFLQLKTNKFFVWY